MKINSVALYMDVHIPRAVTAALRLRSIDVLTAQEDETSELDDESLLQRATGLKRILVTQDQDLLRVGARRTRIATAFFGIIYAHQLRVTIGQMVDDLELIAKAISPEDWLGKIEYLPLKGVTATV